MISFKSLAFNLAFLFVFATVVFGQIEILSPRPYSEVPNCDDLIVRYTTTVEDPATLLLEGEFTMPGILPNITIAGGNNTVTFPLSKLDPGLYTLIMAQNNNFTQPIKFRVLGNCETTSYSSSS